MSKCAYAAFQSFGFKGNTPPHHPLWDMASSKALFSRLNSLSSVSICIHGQNNMDGEFGGLMSSVCQCSIHMDTSLV